MRYTVRHVTGFTYDTPITESVMEARMQPRSDGLQRCLHFALTVSPAARVMLYQDHHGNTVHYFNIPARHARLTLTADALVECDVPTPIPHCVGPGAWAQLDALAASGECWEWTAPSPFTRATARLDAFARELVLERGHDPLVVLRRVMTEIYTRFEYRPQSTRVDSPIDEALEARCGVCQDFAHIFIALMRPLGIPTRYVSGYLFRDLGSHDRSSEGISGPSELIEHQSQQASERDLPAATTARPVPFQEGPSTSHAWAESFIPGLGWVGFDPTNNLVVEARHIRVAIGRDYADVPPTRGVYKGAAAVRSELGVAVRVGPVTSPLTGDVLPFTPWISRDAGAPISNPETIATQQDQQQQ